LDLLILKTLLAGRQHGYGIAQRIKAVSEEVLQVGESSLYPALQRLLLNGWVKAEWGASDNNRSARYYTLTAAGRKQLAVEREEFDRIVLAIHKVLNTAAHDGTQELPELHASGPFGRPTVRHSMTKATLTPSRTSPHILVMSKCQAPPSISAAARLATTNSGPVIPQWRVRLRP
jgi:transcriptional regulator